MSDTEKPTESVGTDGEGVEKLAELEDYKRLPNETLGVFWKRIIGERNDEENLKAELLKDLEVKIIKAGAEKSHKVLLGTISKIQVEKLVSNGHCEGFTGRVEINDVPIHRVKGGLRQVCEELHKQGLRLDIKIKIEDKNPDRPKGDVHGYEVGYELFAVLP